MKSPHISLLALPALLLAFMGAAQSGWAIEVTYGYTLDITGIRGAVAASPFALSDDVQISGSFTIETEGSDSAAARLDLGSYHHAIQEHAFSFSWDEGSYSTGAATDPAYRAGIRNEDRGAPDGSQTAAQDLFLLQDRSEYADLGEYEFQQFNIRLEDNVDAAVFEEDGLPEELPLDALNNAVFVLRFADDDARIGYSGYVSDLTDLAAGPDPTDAAVPLPSSLMAMLGVMGIGSLAFRRHQRAESRRSEERGHGTESGLATA